MSKFHKLLVTIAMSVVTLLLVTGCVPTIQDEDIVYISFKEKQATLNIGDSGELQVLAYDKENIAYDITDSVTLIEGNSTIVTLNGKSFTVNSTGQTSIIASYIGLKATKSITVLPQTKPSPRTPNPFADQYASAIPDDATIESYDSRRFGVVTGVVQNENEQPLDGVRITVKGHPEYGSTLTNDQGFFELATEASGFQIIDYQKEGYTPLQRKVKTSWNQIVNVDTVTMLSIDAKSTFIDLGIKTPQIHESSTISDARGERSATIVFNGVTQANVINSDGSSYNLSKFNVRATEFTTPESMPAPLPSTSAFTYCIDVTLDGVADDAMVYFDKNVTFFIDNFLDFPIGTIVPVGYYSRSEGHWIAMNDGIIVKLLDDNGDGIVDGLDFTGDNKADDLNDNNTTIDEIIGLEDKDRYQPDQTYTMFYSNHFTSIDPNHPPKDNKEFDDDKDDDDDEPDLCTADGYNSYVNPGDRSFHEDITIPGTDIKLWYNSKDTQGYHHKFRLNTSDKNIGSLGALFQINIAGQSAKKLLQQTSADKEFIFYWNKKDYNDQLSTTPQMAEISIHKANTGYLYPVCSWYWSRTKYYRYGRGWTSSCSVVDNNVLFGTSIFGLDLNGVEGVEAFVPATAGTVYNYKTSYSTLISGTNNKNIANGWNFDEIHDSINTSILNSQNNKSMLYFNGNTWDIPDYISASGKVYKINSYDQYDCHASFEARKFMADDNENVYKACNDGTSEYIARFGADGTITKRYIGGGTETYGEDTNRTQIIFGTDIGFTLDDEDNIIVADTDNHKIYEQYSTGQFKLLVGNDEGDADGQSFEAKISKPTEPVVDSKGNIYFIDQGNKKIKKISNGEVTTLIGQKADDMHSGDYGLASEATMPMPTHLAIDHNDNLYIGFGNLEPCDLYWNECADYDQRIRMISPQGYIYPIAGENRSISPWSNNRSVEAKYAKMSYLDKRISMFVDPQNRLRVGPYIITKDTGITVLDQLTRLYSYQNGNILKTYDSEYKHLNTIDIDTNTTLYSFTYTPEGKLETITDKFDQTTTIEYSGETPTAIIAPNGDRLSLEVDGQRNLTAVTYPDGNTQRFEYDENNLMTKMTEPNGNSFTHEYDEHGRLVNFLDEEGGKWTYDITIDDINRSRTITKTSALGNTRVKTYTTLANGTKSSEQIDPDGTVSTMSSTGTTTTSETCGIRKTTVPFTYGTATGSRTSTYYKNDSDSFNFNANSFTYTDISYFGEDTNKVKSTISTLIKNIYVYSSFRPEYGTAFTKTTIKTDYENSTTIITTPENRVVTSTFDPKTQLPTKVESAGLLPVNYTYDTKGQVTSVTQGDRTASYLYDNKDDLVTEVDAEGIPTYYEYDAMHRVTKVSRAGQEIQYTYDANGNLASTTTPNKAVFTQNSNNINYLSTFTSPFGFTKSYTYTPDRELESITLPSGKQIAYTYEATNLSKQTTPETTTNYTYGCGGLLTVQSNDNGESINYTYDGMRRVTDVVYRGMLNETVSYTGYYPLLDLPRSMEYAGGSSLFSYDKDGLMTRATNYTLNRDADTGRLKYIDKYSGVIEFNSYFTYNEYGEISSKKDTIKGNRLYAYDILDRTPSGKIITKAEQGVSDKPTVYQYTYDQAGRLTTVQTDSEVTESYLYDHNGNRLEATINGTTTKASYTIEDQLEVYGQNTYRYDDDGYLTEMTTPEGTTTYTYGTLGELRAVQTPTQTITYKHNANNQRVAKLIDGEVVEKYLWADLTTLLAVYDKDDNVLQRFEYAAPQGHFLASSGHSRMPLGMTQGSKEYYLHYDQVGTLKAVSDLYGNIVKEITYDTFGNILTDSNETFRVPFGFAGGLYDGDTKLTRFGYRDYDAETGKWTAKDPIDFDGGDSNLYGYVLGDPVNFVDPDGLMSMRVPPRMLPKIPFKRPFPGFNPSKSPGKGFEWRGKPNSKPGDKNGNYYNPKTGESCRPDLDHPKPIGPHWDYKSPAGDWYRIHPDGSMIPKGVVPTSPIPDFFNQGPLDA